jgi:hypothetical protein
MGSKIEIIVVLVQYRAKKVNVQHVSDQPGHVCNHVYMCTVQYVTGYWRPFGECLKSIRDHLLMSKG